MSPVGFGLFVLCGTFMLCLPAAVFAWTHWNAPSPDPGRLALEIEVKSLRLQRDLRVATVEKQLEAMEACEKKMAAWPTGVAEWREELDSYKESST